MLLFGIYRGTVSRNWCKEHHEDGASYIVFYVQVGNNNSPSASTLIIY
jgi:hypothetical protein